MKTFPTLRPSGWHRGLYIASLMLAGEAIYMLPYMRKTSENSMEDIFSTSVRPRSVFSAPCSGCLPWPVISLGVG